MNDLSSQVYESFVPIYDAVPEKWEDAREFLVEHLKKISQAVNVRTIGYYLDEELISGIQFIPSATNNTGAQSAFRSVLRFVTDVSPLVVGPNPKNHSIKFDVNFTLIDLWCCGTNSTTFEAVRITGDDVVMNATTFTITSPLAFDRAFVFCEYIQEE